MKKENWTKNENGENGHDDNANHDHDDDVIYEFDASLIQWQGF